MKRTYYDKWNKAVSRLACGRKLRIPFYCTIRAYKTPAGRRFAVSDSQNTPCRGNLSLAAVRTDLIGIAYQVESNILFWI